MILKRSDIDEFIEEYSDFQLEYGSPLPLRASGIGTNISTKELKYWSIRDANYPAIERFLVWLNDHPQVLMPSGLQEYLSAESLDHYELATSGSFLDRITRPAFRLFKGSWILPSIIGDDRREPWDAIELRSSGDAFEIDESGLPPIVPFPSADEIIANAEKFLDSPYNDVTTFSCAKIWSPGEQKAQRLALQSSTSDILGEIQSQEKELADISWKTLEEIVAEVLRARGLEVYHVTDTPQGGRDVIVRGALAPGLDPMTIAVEVKHRDLIDRPAIQQAIAQNAHYPALMFVTSGRFTAGVLKEAQKPENHMRLFLKDGVAIGDMIAAYKTD